MVLVRVGLKSTARTVLPRAGFDVDHPRAATTWVCAGQDDPSRSEIAWRPAAPTSPPLRPQVYRPGRAHSFLDSPRVHSPRVHRSASTRSSPPDPRPAGRRRPCRLWPCRPVDSGQTGSRRSPGRPASAGRPAVRAVDQETPAIAIVPARTDADLDDRAPSPSWVVAANAGHRARRAGHHGARPIQAATLPDSLAGRDVLRRGRTGLVRTYAFVLPMLARLTASRSPRRPSRPPRADPAAHPGAATQIEAAIARWRPHCPCHPHGVRRSGTNPQHQGFARRGGHPGCLPGRLADHIREGYAAWTRGDHRARRADQWRTSVFLPRGTPA